MADNHETMAVRRKRVGGEVGMLMVGCFVWLCLHRSPSILGRYSKPWTPRGKAEW